MAWDYAKAVAAVEALALTGGNVVLAHYWLSLWRGGAPPPRGDFHPARISQLLPGISIMGVNDRAVCRLAGSAIDLAFGRDMQGSDPLDFVSGEARRVRQARIQAIVDGGIALSEVRYWDNPFGIATTQVLQLPFHGVAEDGSRQYISHANWRPGFAHATRNTTPYDNALPDSYRAVAIS